MFWTPIKPSSEGLGSCEMKDNFEMDLMVADSAKFVSISRRVVNLWKKRKSATRNNHGKKILLYSNSKLDQHAAAERKLGGMNDIHNLTASSILCDDQYYINHVVDEYVLKRLH